MSLPVPIPVLRLVACHALEGLESAEQTTCHLSSVAPPRANVAMLSVQRGERFFAPSCFGFFFPSFFFFFFFFLLFLLFCPLAQAISKRKRHRLHSAAAVIARLMISHQSGRQT